MEQRLSVITLGVGDLERARAFYEGTLGWTPTGEAESLAFYNVGGFILALYPHEELASDMGPRGPAPAGPYRGFTLALNLGSRAEVDLLFAELKARGVQVIKPPEDAFWGGYSGYFTDVEGNAWEVAHNPFWTLDQRGRPIAPGEREARP